MRRMKTIRLISVLSAAMIQLHAHCLIHGLSDARIDASGETLIVEEEATTCEPRELVLHGRAISASCDSLYQIATLSSSPRRCIHIEVPPVAPQANAVADICTNFPGWFDGTNGCDAYQQNEGWCDEYGDFKYESTSRPANEACCACGGGVRSKPRLMVGDHVKLTKHHVLGQGQCKSLKIVDIETNRQFKYVVEVMKPCGPMGYMMDANGHVKPMQQFQAGLRMDITTDDPNVISKHIKVELKKCRRGMPEQEFEVVPMGGDDENANNEMATIFHPLTGLSLSSALDVKSSRFFNITQVFEDGLFEGSSDYYFLKMNVNQEGHHSHFYLGSGHFGEKEYSEVETYLHPNKHFEEQEFAMWQFKPVLKSGDYISENNVVGEHEQWLVRMTNLIGIDYLGELPPWHLLDVERDASKGDVKSRFRELSRIFHPDKILAHHSDKKELFERIFVLLQNAYQGLKTANEAEKEDFKTKAESSSQLFAYSQSVVELLPFHWSKLENSGGRYVLNVASHLNSTSLNSTSSEDDEFDPSVQLWVTFMYSARCGMSRSVVGMLDLAARHLEQHENIKVGSYGCGIYKEYPPIGNDLIGVMSDPICSQFRRQETPNVHLIVETIPGKKRDENGELVEYYPVVDIMKENARFKHFYADVPSGNITQFFPHKIIDFAKAAKMVWENNRLVHRMMSEDFSTPPFIDSVSIVAYLDGTGNDESNDGKSNVVDAILSSLPGVARRFFNDDFYVGIALCGFGDEENIDVNVGDSHAHIDCSKLGVSWLPNIKVYANNDTTGVSLLRGEFSDMRDVQIALESMGNTIRMLLGGTDDYEDDINELQGTVGEEGGGDCENQKHPPPEQNYDQKFVKIDDRMVDTPLLEGGDGSDEIKPARKTDSATRSPKLASASNKNLLAGERSGDITRNRISGFHKRETRTVGGGALLGGGSGGNAGLIA